MTVRIRNTCQKFQRSFCLQTNQVNLTNSSYCRFLISGTLDMAANTDYIQRDKKCYLELTRRFSYKIQIKIIQHAIPKIL